MTANGTEIRISKRDGSVRGIYSEDTASVLSGLGQTQTRRASRVDPTGDLTRGAKHWLRNERRLMEANLPSDVWWADLTPVGGPVLGPFNVRDIALSEEIKWLKKNGLPFPSDDR